MNQSKNGSNKIQEDQIIRIHRHQTKFKRKPNCELQELQKLPRKIEFANSRFITSTDCSWIVEFRIGQNSQTK